MWAAAAEDEGGEGGRGGGRSLKWQDCITSHRGNRRKARENGKLEKEGAWYLYVRKFGAAYVSKLAERGQISKREDLLKKSARVEE